MTPRRRHRQRGRVNGNGRVAPTPRVWPEDEPGRPPLEGIVAALGSFERVGDLPPLAAEVQMSVFLSMLGAGGPSDDAPDEPDHEELLNGIVEVCLHHLDDDLPRVVLDFLWVLDAMDLGWVHWPLRERLRQSRYPSRPAWAMDVGQAEVVSCQRIAHETGDGYDVALVARHRSAERDHVIAVYVDKTLGGLATDALEHEDADEYLQMVDDTEGMVRERIDPAVAAATLDEAIDATFGAGVPPAVADEFSSLWVLAEHYLAKLPPGGAPLPDPPVAPLEACAAAVDRFLESPSGMAHRGDREPLLEAVVFVAEELGGDPLRWTAPVTQLVVQGWLALSGFAADVQERFPSVVRAFVPWAHEEKGWGDRYVSEALAVLDVPARAGEGEGIGRVDVLEQAVAAGVDLDDEEALDAFLDDYLAGREDRD